MKIEAIQFFLLCHSFDTSRIVSLLPIILKSQCAMKLLQSVRKFYATIGICPSQSSGGVLIHFKRAFFLIATMPISVSVAGYFLFKASTTRELTQTFYLFSYHVGCILNYVISLLKLSEIFEIMDKLEEISEKSKLNVEHYKRYRWVFDWTFFISYSIEFQKPSSKAKYSKLSENFEHTSNIVHFVLAKMAPVLIMMPILILTIFNYFACDSNGAVYVLPFPILCVKNVEYCMFFKLFKLIYKSCIFKKFC